MLHSKRKTIKADADLKEKGEYEMAKTKGFEESIKELEEIVEMLEKGDEPLEKSLELFETGIKLSKACQKMLDNAEKKVCILMQNDAGEVEKQDFTGVEE